MEKNVEQLADEVVQKVRHYLVTARGRLLKDASADEFYEALCLALREEVMINWAATARTQQRNESRHLYYMSLEYLPGRLLSNTVSNLHGHEVVKAVLQKVGRDYREILTLEPDPGLGNGGLGRLASCLLDSMATHAYPVTAYGLRYQYGIFQQQIWEGMQVEVPDPWLLNENPWELRKDARARMVKFAGQTQRRMNRHGETVLDLAEYEEVRALPFDFPIVGYSETRDYPVITLRLWSTKDSPHNFHLQRYNAGHLGPAAENTALTDVLYPNDNHDVGKRIRLKQEFLLVSATLQDIFARHLHFYGDVTTFADKVRIQINDTHPALVIAELMRRLTKNFDLHWKAAWEITQEVVGYTNHTILREALEEWNQERLRTLLPRQYWVIERLNEALMHTVRERFPDDIERPARMSLIEGGQVKMAHLAIFGSHKVNGVAKLHGEILKESVFKDFYDLFPDKFTSVTNGVTQRHWLCHCNPHLALFIRDRIGKEWLTDFSQMRQLENFASDRATQEAFLEIKRKNKERLIRFLARSNPERDLFGNVMGESVLPDPDSLFDVQVKRFHEYKRQLLNTLHLILLYFELRADPNSRQIKRTAIIAGKAAPGYEMAKNIIRLIHCVARKVNQDPAIQGKLRIVFIENYNVSRAEVIIPAADLSEQISTAGTEASGTGNMKLTINGALTIGTEDGANIEMRQEVGDRWWPFSFGANAETVQKIRLTYNPWEILEQHPHIKQAVAALQDGTFALNESENEALISLHDILVNGSDRYLVLHDLPAYYKTQKQVEALYLKPNEWAETALHNMAGMGNFSTDRSVADYAQKIWGIEKCPLDPSLLKQVRNEYTHSA